MIEVIEVQRKASPYWPDQVEITVQTNALSTNAYRGSAEENWQAFDLFGDHFLLGSTWTEEMVIQRLKEYLVDGIRVLLKEAEDDLERTKALGTSA